MKNNQFESLTEYNNFQELIEDDMTISDVLGNSSLTRLEDIYFKLAAYESTRLTPDNVKDMIKDFEEILDCNENPDNGKYCAFHSITGCRLKEACGACIPKWRGSLSKEQIEAEIERFKKEI